ncbi:phosphopantetheine adenylyltransferase [Halorientalis sp. IM1011]|uniref:phosphopantetheine adenylyltransferase n=1 Tax=Halorientalis sp. IM1011 TaxID=1932360 RepID=UPI00097CC863|nr:pantetheine-phosphate adenylyltransferase [Halorientalis sp. IM1011]AQL42023.1 phosphopantetheine adenylyltransferase [Halorientalis sp. IM1011]
MTGTRVAVAGTFGPLHDGHRNLLRTALQYGDDGVIVGLTSDAFAQASRTRAVPPFEQRRTALKAAIEDLDEWDRPVEIRRLTDEHGIVSEDPEIDALVVSPETAQELAAINDGRREKGFEPIQGIVAPYVLAEDGERISSTRIVRGEIDEHGRVRD